MCPLIQSSPPDLTKLFDWRSVNVGRFDNYQPVTFLILGVYYNDNSMPYEFSQPCLPTKVTMAWLVLNFDRKSGSWQDVKFYLVNLASNEVVANCES